MCSPGQGYDGVGLRSRPSCRECPVGTYQPFYAPSLNASCRPCYPGFYCSTQGLKMPTGPCVAGYYCPEGSSNALARPCPEISFCLEACASPVRCPSGLTSDQGSYSINNCSRLFTDIFTRAPSPVPHG